MMKDTEDTTPAVLNGGYEESECGRNNNRFFMKYKFTLLAVLGVALCFVVAGVIGSFFVKSKQSDSLPNDLSFSESINEINVLRQGKALEEETESETEGIIDETTNPPVTEEIEVTDSAEFEEKLNIRLPSYLVPYHYYIRLLPFVNGNFTLLGYIEISFKVVKPTRNIVLHIKDIIIKNDTVKVQEGLTTTGDKTEAINKQTYDPKTEFYAANLADNLKVGSNYTIYLEYEGYLNDILHGFYRSSYTDESGEKRMLAVTFFQPTYARMAFPCFDEPAFKAEFSVVIGREKNMSSLSNMPKIGEEPIENMPGWFWDSFEKSPPMSTYIVAFAVSPFTYKESPDIIDYKFRVWAKPNAIEKAEYAIKIGKPMLRFFEDYLNVSYSLPKQDKIALPDFSAGAMENWGLMTYRESLLLHDQESDTARQKQRIGLIIGHELAHNWFGNLVSPKWWTDLWLNEGFALYLEYVGLNAIEPSYKALDQIVYDDLQDAMTVDSLESSSIVNPISAGESNDINEIFNNIAYLKASSLIRMMSHFLTEETFRRGLAHYLRGKQYNNSVQDELWQYLSEQAASEAILPTSITVKDIMDTWTLQKGYPLVTITSKQGNLVNIMQEKFQTIASIHKGIENKSKWWIPITYTTQRKRDFTNTKPSLWMTPEESEKLITGFPSDEWYIFNIQQTSYYRVNYNEENWNALINQLMTDHDAIGVVNRAQLIDDALSLSRAGQLSYNISMNVLKYLSREKEYLAWASALRNLKFMECMLAPENAEVYKSFVISMIGPEYDHLGFDQTFLNDHLDKLKSELITARACSLSYKPCVTEAMLRFNEIKNSPNMKITSGNKEVIYCTAIREGGNIEWQTAWDRYANATDQSDTRDLLKALGCSKDKQILLKYIQSAMNPESGIRKQDAATVIASVSENVEGKIIAWEFIRQNWSDLLKFYGDLPFTFGRILRSVTQNLNAESQLDEFNKFAEASSHKLKPIQKGINQAREVIENNVAWMNTQYQYVTKWIKENSDY